MKLAEVRRFVNENVVGQKFDGLLFEGKVEEKNRESLVVKVEEGSRDVIDPRRIKWLAVANRYCYPVQATPEGLEPVWVQT